MISKFHRQGQSDGKSAAPNWDLINRLLIMHVKFTCNNLKIKKAGPIAERSNSSCELGCGRGDPSLNPGIGWQIIYTPFVVIPSG